MQEGSDLHRDNVSDESYLPRPIGSHITHYYGDHIRRLFVAVAILLLVSAPFVGSVSTLLVIIQITLAVSLVILSALTSPKNKNIMLINAGASLIGIILFELLAFAAYRAEAMVPMIGFQLLAVAFIFSLYFSLKTARSMDVGLIGKRDLPGEFLEKKHREAHDQF